MLALTSSPTSGDIWHQTITQLEEKLGERGQSDQPAGQTAGDV